MGEGGRRESIDMIMIWQVQGLEDAQDLGGTDRASAGIQVQKPSASSQSEASLSRFSNDGTGLTTLPTLGRRYASLKSL